MSAWKSVLSVWNNIKEFEVAPIQKEALQEIHILLTGVPGSGRHTLAGRMLTDPARPALAPALAGLRILDLPDAERAAPADLMIILVDAAAASYAAEQAVARRWRQAGVKTVVLFNQRAQAPIASEATQSELWEANQVLYGSVLDTAFLLEQFVPAVWGLLVEKQLTLGRNFPLFRVPIARQLINEASLSNAAYALSTGLAEIVPMLDIPLNITDMVILTKAQAFLVYRLGLLLGYSIYWQNYLSEFGSVIGAGFFWRQAARELIGLVPVWGIVPKVAISYAGTYVVGSTVLQWYLTGRKLTRQQINAMYSQALEQGRQYARRLVERLPKVSPPRLPAWKLPRLQLPAKTAQQPVEAKPKPAPKRGKRVCPTCGQRSAPDANFCQYCGAHFMETQTEPEPPEIPLN